MCPFHRFITRFLQKFPFCGDKGILRKGFPGATILLPVLPLDPAGGEFRRDFPDPLPELANANIISVRIRGHDHNIISAAVCIERFKHTSVRKTKRCFLEIDPLILHKVLGLYFLPCERIFFLIHQDSPFSFW